MSINLVIAQFKKYEKTVLEEDQKSLDKRDKPKTVLDEKLEMQNMIDLMLLQKSATKF